MVDYTGKMEWPQDSVEVSDSLISYDKLGQNVCISLIFSKLKIMEEQKLVKTIAFTLPHERDLSPCSFGLKDNSQIHYYLMALQWS